MGLRELLLLVVTFLTVQSTVADYESNGRNLSWIYDIKNSETTQNQTYKLDTETGAFRYHFDVSAVDSYKFETNSNDAVIMGCYGWKDETNKWHATNYVADSHGRRNVRNISKPVDVYPTENERSSRLFLDYLPQCLAFVVDSPPLIMYVFTNHAPGKEPPQGLDHHDHVPHSSEQVHKIHQGSVPEYLGAQAPLTSQLGGATRGGTTLVGPAKQSSDLVGAVSSVVPTRSSLRTANGRQDPSKGSSRGSSKDSSRLSKSSGRVTPSGGDGLPLLSPSKTPLGIDISGLQTGSGTTVGPTYATSGNSIDSIGKPSVSTSNGGDGLYLSKGSGTGSGNLDKSIGTLGLSSPSSGTHLGKEPLIGIGTTDGNLGGGTTSVDLDKASGPSLIGSSLPSLPAADLGLHLVHGTATGLFDQDKASGLKLGGTTGLSTPAGESLLSKGRPTDVGKTPGLSLDGDLLHDTITTGLNNDLSKESRLTSVNLQKSPGPSLIGTQFATKPGISLDQLKGSQTGKTSDQNSFGTPHASTSTVGQDLALSKGNPVGAGKITNPNLSKTIGTSESLTPTGGTNLKVPAGGLTTFTGVDNGLNVVGSSDSAKTSNLNPQKGGPKGLETTLGASSAGVPILSTSDFNKGSLGHNTPSGQNLVGISGTPVPSREIGINLGEGSSTGPLGLGKTLGINLVGTSQISTPYGSISLDLGKGSLQGSLEVDKNSGLNLVGTSKTSPSFDVGPDLGKPNSATGQSSGKVSGQKISTPTGLDVGKGSLGVNKGNQNSNSIGASLSSTPTTNTVSDDSKESLMDIIDKSKSALKNVFNSVVNTVVSAGKQMLGMPDDDDTSSAEPTEHSRVGPSTKGSRVYTLKPVQPTELFTFTPASPTGTSAGQAGGSKTTFDSKLVNIPILSGTGQTTAGYKVDVPSSGSPVTGGVSTIGVTGVTSSGPSAVTPGPKITSFGELIPKEGITSKNDEDDAGNQSEDDDDKRPNFLKNFASLKTALADKFGIKTPTEAQKGVSSSPASGAKTTNIGNFPTHSGPSADRPFEVSTPLPVSKLHIDVTEYIPTSSRRPDTSLGDQQPTAKPGTPSVTASGVTGVKVTGGGTTGVPALGSQIVSGVKLGGASGPAEPAQVWTSNRGTTTGPGSAPQTALGGGISGDRLTTGSGSAPQTVSGGRTTAGQGATPQFKSGVWTSNGGTTTGTGSVPGVRISGGGTTAGPGATPQFESGVWTSNRVTTTGTGSVPGVRISGGGATAGPGATPQFVSGVWTSNGGTITGPGTASRVSVSGGTYGGNPVGPTPAAPMEVSLFEPHQTIDLTELSKVVAELGASLTTPSTLSVDQGVTKSIEISQGLPVSTTKGPSSQPDSQFHWSVSPLLSPSSTPFTAEHTYLISPKPDAYGPSTFGPTTTPDLLRTVTARYLPPPSGDGPMCSCVCPRG